MSMFDSTAIPVLQQVVGFTEARHGVLAGNIANLDTPGYKTRDLSPERFQESLREALVSRAMEHSSNRSRYGNSSSHATSTSETIRHDAFDKVKDAFRSVLRHDEVDVSIESQVTEIAKNQAEHNLALTIMISQFRLMEAAISERA